MSGRPAVDPGSHVVGQVLPFASRDDYHVRSHGLPCRMFPELLVPQQLEIPKITIYFELRSQLVCQLLNKFDRTSSILDARAGDEHLESRTTLAAASWPISG